MCKISKDYTIITGVSHVKLLSVISHTLLEEQVEEAKNTLKVNSIILMPEEIKNIWSNITPHGHLPIDELSKVIKWINKESDEGDYVLVQGDFGATYYVVDYCIKNNRLPIYSTTQRLMEEYVEDGLVKIKRVFQHVNFRSYVPYDYKKEV